jgi:hypothetical protein
MQRRHRLRPALQHRIVRGAWKDRTRAAAWV